MYVIIRVNPVTGHSYVHSDGWNDMTFAEHKEAFLEAKRIQALGGTHEAHIRSAFKNTRDAHKYCELIGQGLDHEEAMLSINAAKKGKK